MFIFLSSILIEIRGDTTVQVRMSERRITNKKHKRMLYAEELLCPITLMLPWDPVHAEDGKVYEREALAKHLQISRDKGTKPRSPVTNKEMGFGMFPAPHIKNLIEKLILNGDASSEVSSACMEKMQEKATMEVTLSKAKRGSVRCLTEVACSYRNGTDGFKKDFKASHSWFKKALMAGCVKSMAVVGANMCHGCGVERNIEEGVTYLTLVANRGSRYAAFNMGRAMLHGFYGLRVDKNRAKYFLEKSIKEKGGFIDMSSDGRDDARKLLCQISPGSK